VTAKDRRTTADDNEKQTIIFDLLGTVANPVEYDITIETMLAREAPMKYRPPAEEGKMANS